MSSPTSNGRPGPMPACSVGGCVDLAEVRVSLAYAETVFLCARHGAPLRAVVLEVLSYRPHPGNRPRGIPNGPSHTT